MSDELEVLASGSTRTKTKVNWHLLPVSALRAYEERMSLGMATHGARNWEKGQPWEVIWNHMMEHMMKLRKQLEGGITAPGDDTPEQNCGAIMWGAGAMVYFMTECTDEKVEDVFYGREQVE